MRVDPEKLKKHFRPAEELITECVGPAGSPEREEMETTAKAWFYGEILRERRKELKMSQTALAEKIGTKQSYIARIEKGEVDIQLSSLLRIANALGLNVQLQ
ncbi:helix-turn-helix transcriptional regulator [uncultured Alistipes sp.]|uniref:helix-turn-helix domain-containing protein n=1 Tax=uncultured Alistipes sp. TaxID=538949 RepID=UPI00262951C9|nr:helix-turn-helix transcriptional regulator [uncultured Alistipes sp.]